MGLILSSNRCPNRLIGNAARSKLTKNPKPKGLNLQELIQVLKTDINAARDAGYTLAEIASTLLASGVEIKENTLKQYLREVKKPANE